MRLKFLCLEIFFLESEGFMKKGAFFFFCFFFCCYYAFSVPVKLSSFTEIGGGQVFQVFKYNDFVILAEKNGIVEVFDVSGNTFIRTERLRLDSDLLDFFHTAAIYGQYLYFPGDTVTGFKIYRLEDNGKLSFVKSVVYDNMAVPSSIAISDNLLFIYGKEGLDILTLQNPEAPLFYGKFVSQNFLNSEIRTIGFKTDVAVLSYFGKGIEFIGFSDPANITVLGYNNSNTSLFYTNSISFYKDNYLILNFGAQLNGYEIASDYSTVTQIYSETIGNSISRFKLYGDGLYVNSGYTLELLDLSGFPVISSLGQIVIDNGMFFDCILDNSYLYTANGTGGVECYSVSSGTGTPYSVSFNRVSGRDYNSVRYNRASHYGNYFYATNYMEGINIVKVNGDIVDEELLPVNYPGNMVRTQVFLKTVAKSQYPFLAFGVGYNILFYNLYPDPGLPVFTTSISLPAYVIYFVVQEDYLYLSTYDTAEIWDISDITNPVKLSSFQTVNSNNHSFYVYGDYWFLNNEIWDISDKSAPVHLGDNALDGFGFFLCEGKGHYMYGLNVMGLKVVDISNPSNLVKIKDLKEVLGYPTDVIVSENNLIVVAYNPECSRYNSWIFNIEDPSNPVLQYAFRGYTYDFVEGTDYYYAVMNSGTITLLCPAYSVPHIATEYGWGTFLVFDNYGDNYASAVLKLFDTATVYTSHISIPPYQQSVVQLYSGQYGEVLVPKNCKLSTKVSYFHFNENGIAEFILSDEFAFEQNFYFPQYLSDSLTWFGMANANLNLWGKTPKFTPYKGDGTVLSAKSEQVLPFTRYADLLSRVFPDYDWKSIARVKQDFYVPCSGIVISGNGNSRLLFTPATIEKDRENTRYLPHLDVHGWWRNYLIFDNPTDSAITVNIVLYDSSGNIVAQEAKTINPNSNLTLLLNDYGIPELSTGKIENCGKDLIVRLSYLYEETGATAEFLIDGSESSFTIVYDLPAYRQGQLNWYGLAICNPSENTVNVTLKAYSGGIIVDTATMTLLPNTKFADVVDDIFTNLNGQVVERVIAEADGMILGLNISGSSQDRYLFSKAFPY